MSHDYVAFELHQKPGIPEAPKLYLFHAPVKDILEWSAIDRLSRERPSGIQRPSTRARILGVRRYFAVERNVVPTAIVVAIDGATVRPVTGCHLADGTNIDEEDNKVIRLSIPQAVDGVKSAIVLDGQHRLLGANEFREDLRLPVVAFIDADINEKAFQFLVINNKAAKVPTDHIRAMLHGAGYDEEVLVNRLDAVRLNVKENTRSVRVMDVDPESPFKGLIKWPHNLDDNDGNPVQHGFIPPAAIEVAISSISSRAVKDLQDDESIDEFFIAMWSTVKDAWPDIFSSKQESGSSLLSKVGIVCLTEFLYSRLREFSLNKRLNISMGDPDSVKQSTRDLLDDLAPEFWTAQWKSVSYDTRAGRDQILDALDCIRGNKSEGRPWYEDVDMVTPPNEVNEG